MANRLSKAAKDLETASKRVSEGTISEGAMDLLKAGFADLQKQKGALAAHALFACAHRGVATDHVGLQP